MPTPSISPADARGHIDAWSRAVGKYACFANDIDHGSSAIQPWDTSSRALNSRLQEAWLAMPTWLAATPPWSTATDFPPLLRSALEDVEGDGDAQIQAVRSWCPDASDEAICTFLRALATLNDYMIWKPYTVRGWLKQRYRRLWESGPYLTEDAVDQALKVSLEQGEWDVKCLGQLAGPAWPRVLVDVYEDANAIAPPWNDLRVPTSTDYARFVPPGPPIHTLESVPRHAAMVLHFHGASDKDIIAAVKRNLERVRPYIGQPLGTRPRGKPGDYGGDVEVYNTYRSWTQEHQGGKAAFVNAHGYPASHKKAWRVSVWPGEVSGGVIKKRLARACQWLDPDPTVPETVDGYLEHLRQAVEARAKDRGFVLGIPALGD